MEEVAFEDPRVSHLLWDKLQEDEGTGCWIYFGNRYTPTGWPVHGHKPVWRVLYSKLVGPIPPKVNMLCDMDPKDCVNPYHRANPYGEQTAPHLCHCGRMHTPD